MTNIEKVVQRITAGAVGIGDLEVIACFSLEKELVVELGTNIGTTTMLLAYCAKYVVTIDVFESLDLIEDAQQRATYKNSFSENNNTFSAIKKKLEPFTNIEVIQGLSYASIGKFVDKTVDTIFIDADHSYAGVKRDYISWFPKVKIGGHFIFHDVWPTFGVFEFYNAELMKNLDIREVHCEPPVHFDTSIKVFRRIQ